MTPEDLFYHIFESLPRQGPGCSAATNRAFAALPSPVRQARVLDLGCGTGAQTFDLARITGGTITAVDNHQPFLDAVNARVEKEGLSRTIQTLNASMDKLPFPPGQFDLIWSEGAIFIIGFEKGLSYWKQFLAGNGSVVVSDIAWFGRDPPEEITAFLSSQGAAMATEEEKKEQVAAAGFRLLETFRLPESGWWEHYYVPMLECVAQLRKVHGTDPALVQVLDSFDKEAALYARYKRYYGYTFFVMQAA